MLVFKSPFLFVYLNKRKNVTDIYVHIDRFLTKIFWNKTSHKYFCGSCELPHTCWAQFVKQFGRLLNTNNEQQTIQTDNNVCVMNIEEKTCID